MRSPADFIFSTSSLARVSFPGETFDGSRRSFSTVLERLLACLCAATPAAALAIAAPPAISGSRAFAASSEIRCFDPPPFFAVLRLCVPDFVVVRLCAPRLALLRLCPARPLEPLLLRLLDALLLRPLALREPLFAFPVLLVVAISVLLGVVVVSDAAPRPPPHGGVAIVNPRLRPLWDTLNLVAPSVMPLPVAGARENDQPVDLQGVRSVEEGLTDRADVRGCVVTWASAGKTTS